jgi:hypothetical protein
VVIPPEIETSTVLPIALRKKPRECTKHPINKYMSMGKCPTNLGSFRPT